MTAFIDSDVILDVASAREPFVEHSAGVLKLAESGKIRAFTTPLVFSNVCYVLRKEIGKDNTLDFLRKLELIVSVIPIDGATVHSALYSEFKDFEDALEHFASVGAKLDCIVTRNVGDYKSSAIPVFTPQEIKERVLHL